MQTKKKRHEICPRHLCQKSLQMNSLNLLYNIHKLYCSSLSSHGRFSSGSLSSSCPRSRGVCRSGTMLCICPLIARTSLPSTDTFNLLNSHEFSTATLLA